TFLGTGTSVGVPMLGCDCAVCRSDDPRNNRYRCAVLVSTPRGNILIDTPPELRLQLLREKVNVVHAVLFTHYHADHLFGLDDVRPFPATSAGLCRCTAPRRSRRKSGRCSHTRSTTSTAPPRTAPCPRWSSAGSLRASRSPCWASASCR